MFACGQNPIIVEIGEQVTLVEVRVEGQVRIVGAEEFFRLCLEFARVYPQGENRIELDAGAIREEEVATEGLTQEDERTAERTAGKGVVDVTPQQRGELFSGVRFRMKDEKGEQRFDLARGEVYRLCMLASRAARRTVRRISL